MVTPNEPPDTPLARLLDAEHKARERLQRLAGYPDDIREAAHTVWREAVDALRAHRERRPGKDDQA